MYKRQARSLTELGGALLLPDNQVRERLGSQLTSLLDDPESCARMSSAMTQAARPQAAAAVVDELESLVS